MRGNGRRRMARLTERMEQGEPAMCDEELRAILERLCDSHKLPYKSGTLDVWHHFDSEETRMRGDPGSATVRVSERHLLHLVNEQGGAVTDKRIKELLCDIYRRPRRYPGIALPGGS
jgi:hypothetical protein